MRGHDMKKGIMKKINLYGMILFFVILFSLHVPLSEAGIGDSVYETVL